MKSGTKMRASGAVNGSETKANILTETSMASFNLLEHPICLTYPSRIAVSAWIGHVPFAFYLIDVLRPKAIAELGTHYGLSYCAFCQAVKELGLDACCYAIDSWQGDEQTGFYGPEVLADLEQHHNPLYGSFSRLIQSTFDEAAGYFSDHTFDLLHIDGLHTYEAVKKDFEKWLPKMTDRGIVLFHDINVREREFGVWRLWEETKSIYPHFEFVHSHGLGVLAVGKHCPEGLKELFQSSGEAAAKIRFVFSQLGERLELAKELHLIRPVLKDLTAPQQDKELRLQEYERQLKENARQLHEKDTLIHEQTLSAIGFNDKMQASERLLAEKDTQIDQKNLEAISFNQQLQEKDRQVREKDTLLHEKNLKLISLTQQLQDRQHQLTQSDQQLQERDRLIHERNLEIAAHTQRIQNQDQELQTGKQKLGELQQQLQLKERQLQLKHRQLHDREQSEHEKSQLLQEQGVQLRDKDRQFQEVAIQLQEKVHLIGQYDKACAEFGNSGSYKVGRALSWPLRAVKQQLRAILNDNEASDDSSQLQSAHDETDVAQHVPTEAVAVADVDAAYDYGLWVKLFDTLTDADREAIIARIERLAYKPLISILMPVYDIEETWLRKAIESVRQQLYPYWELCIADDQSTQPHVRKVLAEYAGKDSRIKVAYRKTNGNISAASNSALKLATGEYVALLDNDDEIREHALHMVAEELNKYPNADLLYSDEDKINENGERRDPHFKSDWNPDLFYSYNFISHLGVFRLSLVKEIGGFREGYEGSQDYDLVLRTIERISPENIRHIPHVLYHWRALPGSMALEPDGKSYAHEAARKAIRSHLKRIGVEATVSAGYEFHHRVIYPLPDPPPLVSLIIATRDRLELLSQIVNGLLNDTDYEPIEIIIVDNQSKNTSTLKYLREVQKDERVKVTEYDAPFNYSAINNLGVRESSGEFIGLINNDIKVISRGWLKEMISHAARAEVGAVGAKLLYPDDTIQHAGVILGVGGVAGHSHKYLPGQSAGYANRAQVVQNLSAVTGACLVMRRQTFLDIGGLDEIDLTVAFNDVDLCVRIRERGYRIVWTPYAQLYHLESKSRGSDETEENAPRAKKEIEYMKFIWGDTLLNDPYYNPNLTIVHEDFSWAVPARAISPWKNQLRTRS